MKITVQRFGDPLKIERDILTQFIALKDATKTLGEATRDHMRHVIKTTKHRPAGSRGNLEKSIDFYVEDLPNNYTVGVGLRSHMDQVAPYWYIVNFGGFTTVSARGETIWGNFEGYAPRITSAGTGVGTESFFKTGFGGGESFPMTPKNPIWAMNYIEKTSSWLSTVHRVHYSGKTGKVGIFKTKA